MSRTKSESVLPNNIPLLKVDIKEGFIQQDAFKYHSKYYCLAIVTENVPDILLKDGDIEESSYYCEKITIMGFNGNREDGGFIDMSEEKIEWAEGTPIEERVFPLETQTKVSNRYKRVRILLVKLSDTLDIFKELKTPVKQQTHLTETSTATRGNGAPDVKEDPVTKPGVIDFRVKVENSEGSKKHAFLQDEWKTKVSEWLEKVDYQHVISIGDLANLSNLAGMQKPTVHNCVMVNPNIENADNVRLQIKIQLQLAAGGDSNKSLQFLRENIWNEGEPVNKIKGTREKLDFAIKGRKTKVDQKIVPKRGHVFGRDPSLKGSCYVCKESISKDHNLNALRCENCLLPCHQECLPGLIPKCENRKIDGPYLHLSSIAPGAKAEMPHDLIEKALGVLEFRTTCALTRRSLFAKGTVRKCTNCESHFHPKCTPIQDCSIATQLETAQKFMLKDFKDKRAGLKQSFEENIQYYNTIEVGDVLIDTRKPAKINELIKISNFEILGTLGQGSFGTVFLARDKNIKDKSKVVAIKAIEKYTIIDGDSAEDVQTMVEDIFREKYTFQKAANSKHMSSLIFAFDDCRYIYFGMEFLSGADLGTNLENSPGGKFTEKRAMTHTLEILLGLEFMQKNRLLLRDLKLQNVLIGRDGKCQLIDYGFSKVLKEGEMAITFCGTPEYMAPEITKTWLEDYDFRVDVWSAGVCFFEMLTGDYPFGAPLSYDDHDLDALYKKIKFHKINYDEFDILPLSESPDSESKPGKMSQELEGFFNKCLEKDFRQRFNASDAIYSDYFSKSIKQVCDDMATFRKGKYTPAAEVPHEDYRQALKNFPDHQNITFRKDRCLKINDKKNKEFFSDFAWENPDTVTKYIGKR